MRTRKIAIDTNLLIRFLLDDVSSQVDRIESLFRKAKRNELEVVDVVLVETVYVLLSVYKLDKDEIVESVSKIISFSKFKLKRKLFKKVADIYQHNNISFVDAYLCARAATGMNSFVYTFDKKLKKVNQQLIKFP